MIDPTADCLGKLPRFLDISCQKVGVSRPRPNSARPFSRLFGSGGLANRCHLDGPLVLGPSPGSRKLLKQTIPSQQPCMAYDSSCRRAGISPLRWHIFWPTYRSCQLENSPYIQCCYMTVQSSRIVASLIF